MRMELRNCPPIGTRQVADERGYKYYCLDVFLPSLAKRKSPSACWKKELVFQKPLGIIQKEMMGRLVVFVHLFCCVGVARCLSSVVGSVASWSRVVAIGDMHGDMHALRACLRVAGVVNQQGKWSSSPSTLMVCCGDVLGKGREDWACLQYLHSLRDQARDSRSDLVLILGNHEVMNVAGDMRHVSRRSFPGGNVARKLAFRPGGQGALLLNELCDGAPLARIVGDTLFCHGGVHSDFLHRHRRPGESYRRIIRRLNADACDWLNGRQWETPSYLTPGPHGDSPAWLTAYSNPPDAEPHPNACRDAVAALDLLRCDRMVVGHTPQLSAGCNTACGGAVIRIDTGASNFYGGPREALELKVGHAPRVLSAAIRFGAL